jgi:hypothetical protein
LSVLRILFVALSLFFPVLVGGQDDQRVVRPLIEVGDKWTYRGTNILGSDAEEYDVEVASVRGDLIQVVCTRRRDGKEADAIYTGEWSSSSTCDGFISRPPSRYLRFPLIPGTSYPVKFTIHRARKFKHTNEVEGKVVVKGWEHVEVPAGRFRVLRVEADLTVSQPDGGLLRRQHTIWYSSEVRRWVKSRSIARGADTFEEELLAFKLIE